jgi:hypothetical protein
MSAALQVFPSLGRFDRSQAIRTLYDSIVYFTFLAFELIASINLLVPVAILAKNNRVLSL